MNQDDRSPTPGSSIRASTVLESVDELREQIRRVHSVQDATPATESPDAETLVYRPTHRPTMALLYVLDDGDKEAEVIRVRQDCFVIGRTDGDLVIPHDGALSGRHAEVARRLENGQFRWHLRDLKSSNGTFVRIAAAVLTHDQEVLIGSGYFRFEAAPPPPPAAPPSTHKWTVNPVTDLLAEDAPALVALSTRGEGERYPLTLSEHWFGRNPRLCSIVLQDPMVSPRHGRIYQGRDGAWHIENKKSLNGVWFRIDEIALDRSAHFQCGEQRFWIKIP